MKVKIHQIAELIKAKVEGNPDAEVTHPDKIESAGEGAITFFSNPKYEKHLYNTRATAVLLDKNFQLSKPVPATILRVENVYLALSELILFYDKYKDGSVNVSEQAGISEQASISEDVEIGQNVYIGPFTVIESGSRIGDDSYIGSQVYIGKNVQIGSRNRIYPGVRIYRDTVIGNQVTLHANAVLGSDGFGFAQNGNGDYVKIPQIGFVEIGDRVEIGANTVIDRASMGRTIISEGVKLDNLVQVGHNVVIGKNTVIAAQTGISGSTRIGENNQFGGQIGIAGHLNIGSNIKLGGGTGIMSDIEDGGNYIGSPALPFKDFMRSYAVFRQLPKIDKEIYRLKKQLEDMEKKEL